MVEIVRLFHQGARGEQLREKIGKDASDGYLKALADDLFAAKHGEIAAEVVRDKSVRDRAVREMGHGRRR